MAIQMRRGQLANYDKSKMLPGEWGISIDNDSDNQKAFISFAPGVSKEVMMVEDAEEQIAVATAEAIDMATEEAKAWAHGNSFHVNDYASGDGSTKSFTLAETPSSILGVYVDGSSVSAYTLSGKTITFTTAPSSGSNNIRVYYTVNTTTDNAKYYKEQAEEVAESIPEDYSELSDDVDQLKNALIVSNASGSIASFVDGGDGFPVRDLKVQIEPIQAGSGDPSPDNVRPISGKDSVTVTRTGKNLWNWRDTGVICEASASGRTSINDTDKTVRWGSTWGLINLTAGMKWKENTQYTIIVKAYRSDISNIPSNPVSLNSRVYYTDGTYIAIKYVATAVAPAFGIGVITTSANKTVERIQLVNNGGITYVKYDESGIFEGVLTADDFAPYNGQQVTIQLGQTVYGGTLDVTQGVLTVDKAAKTFNGTEDWKQTNNVYYVNQSLNDFVTNDVSWFSNIYLFGGYKSSSSYMTTDKRFYTNYNSTVTLQNRIFVYDTSYATVDAFTTALGTTNLVVVGKLDNPVTVQLTAQQMTTLLGQNNVWSDADSVSVDYVADTKLYIEQLTEPDSDMVADMNITSGNYFMVGNNLYLATANIANGAAIAVGVNCTRTSLAEALNAINS